MNGPIIRSRDRHKAGRLAKLSAKIKAGLRDNRGESLAETLIALLIACMGLVILPGAIIAAARVDKAAEDTYVFMDAERGETQTIAADNAKSFKLTITDGSTGSVELETVDKMDEYDNSAYYYYRLNE